MTPEQIEQMRADMQVGTPGNWWADNNEGYGSNHIWASDPNDQRAKELVAEAIGDSAEDEANMRRIARVPAMEAEILRLRTALTCISDHRCLTSHGDPGVLRDFARAAIAGDAP